MTRESHLKDNGRQESTLLCPLTSANIYLNSQFTHVNMHTQYTHKRISFPLTHTQRGCVCLWVYAWSLKAALYNCSSCTLFKDHGPVIKFCLYSPRSCNQDREIACSNLYTQSQNLFFILQRPVCTIYMVLLSFLPLPFCPCPFKWTRAIKSTVLSLLPGCTGLFSPTRMSYSCF